MQRIQTKEQLKELAKRLGVRKDWHEPDEQEVVATVLGQFFDNAGFWGVENNSASMLPECEEMWVCIFQNQKPVAEVNLATLFAFACDTYTGE